MAGLQMRVDVLNAEAVVLGAYRHLKGNEISALKPEQARDLPEILTPLTITLHQTHIWCEEYAFGGWALRKGNRRKGGFCGVVQRRQQRRAHNEALILRAVAPARSRKCSRGNSAARVCNQNHRLQVPAPQPSRLTKTAAAIIPRRRTTVFLRGCFLSSNF